MDPALATRRQARRLVFPLLLTLLAALHAWLAASVSDEIGVTSDEIAHLTAGHTYWTEQDFRLQPENGLLPQRLAALPNVLANDVRFPDLQSDSSNSKKWATGDVWGLGAVYFYESGNHLPDILKRGRWMIASLGALGVFLIGLWGRSLGGETGGLLAAGLAGLSPTLLAHAGLATSDTAAAVGFVAAILFWWRLLHRVTPTRVALAGISAGLLALAKFSGVLLAPIAAALLLLVLVTRRSIVASGWFGAKPRRLANGSRVLALGTAGVVAALLAVLTIWAGYGFRYSAAGPRAPVEAGFDRSWDKILPAEAYEGLFELADETNVVSVVIRPRTIHRVIAFSRDHRLLPEAWLYGLAYVDLHARMRPAFLAGEWRFTGWRSFFPIAALLKSSPPELILGGLGAAIWIAMLLSRKRSERRLLYRSAPLVVAIIVLGGFSIFSSLNIGHRHLLPVYALGFVLSALCHRQIASRIGRRSALAAAAVLLAAQAWTALSIRPHYLTYFNSIAGGPAAGHRFLVDSSLDWGQGLPALKQWLDAHANEKPVFLSYFGSDRPERLGIEARRFGDHYFRIGQPGFYIHPLEAGLYVISATMWQRTYTHVRGPWTPEFEVAYWKQFEFWRKTPPPLWDGLTRYDLLQETGAKRLANYDHLRLGKLIHGLRSRAPDAIVANQFLVFALTDADLQEILLRPAFDLPPPEASSNTP